MAPTVYIYINVHQPQSRNSCCLVGMGGALNCRDLAKAGMGVGGKIPLMWSEKPQIPFDLKTTPSL